MMCVWLGRGDSCGKRGYFIWIFRSLRQSVVQVEIQWQEEFSHREVQVQRLWNSSELGFVCSWNTPAGRRMKSQVKSSRQWGWKGKQQPDFAQPGRMSHQLLEVVPKSWKNTTRGRIFLLWSLIVLLDPTVCITGILFFIAMNISWFSLCHWHYRENQEDTGRPFTLVKFTVILEDTK